MIRMYHRSGERAFGESLRVDWDELPACSPALVARTMAASSLRRHGQSSTKQSLTPVSPSVTPEDAVQRQYAESLEIWRIALETVGRAPGASSMWGAVAASRAGDGMCRARNAFRAGGAVAEARTTARSRRRALGLTNVESMPCGPRKPDKGRSATGRPGHGPGGGQIARIAGVHGAVREPVAELIALPKGSAFAGDSQHLGEPWRSLGCALPGNASHAPGDQRNAVDCALRKGAPTPKQYPRRPGTPRKFPL